MAGLIRDMLDCLSNDALRGLCEARGLLLSGTKNDRAGRLAKSFRGDAAPLVDLLRRQDMVDILSQWEFSLEDGRWGGLVGVSNAAKDDLERWMTKVFVNNWDPSQGQLQPFRNSSISIDWHAADEDEDDDDLEDDEDDLEDDEDDLDDKEAVDNDEDVAPSHLDSTEQFWHWLRGKLQDRGASTMLVKTMVNQLGHHRAHQRLRGDAVRELAAVLAAGGFQTVPDLGSMESSPGIDFRVRVFRRGTQLDTLPHVREDWQPIPKIAPPPRDARPPAPDTPKSAMATDFERGAAKLRFLVTVAASIARPSDEVRNRAIEESARELRVAIVVAMGPLAAGCAANNEDTTGDPDMAMAAGGGDPDMAMAGGGGDGGGGGAGGVDLGPGDMAVAVHAPPGTLSGVVVYGGGTAFRDVSTDQGHGVWATTSGTVYYFHGGATSTYTTGNGLAQGHSSWSSDYWCGPGAGTPSCPQTWDTSFTSVAGGMAGQVLVGHIGYSVSRLDVDPASGAVLDIVGVAVTSTQQPDPTEMMEQQQREVASWKVVVDLAGTYNGSAYFGGWHGTSALHNLMSTRSTGVCGQGCGDYEEHIHGFWDGNTQPGGRDVRALAITKQGDLWMGDADTIAFSPQRSLGPETNLVATAIPGMPGQTSIDVFPNVTDNTWGLAVDDQGGLYVASYGNGLAYLAAGTYAATYWTAADKLPQNYLTGVVVEPSGDVWIATQSAGVARYQPSTNTWVHYTTASGLPSNDIRAIYLDQYAASGRGIYFATGNGVAGYTGP